ncbi:uncharacterized protein [Elaeis guineensis]|uniref:uncharacterized protein isoform X6 n=1 Tax=Elaeis guineensis var. tenera TaxID=51953 RepID=UPI003C6D3D2E
MIQERRRRGSLVVFDPGQDYDDEEGFNRFGQRRTNGVGSSARLPPMHAGPLIDKAAVEKGANVILGGKRDCLGMTFYEPTVLGNVNDEMLVSSYLISVILQKFHKMLTNWKRYSVQLHHSCILKLKKMLFLWLKMQDVMHRGAIEMNKTPMAAICI